MIDKDKVTHLMDKLTASQGCKSHWTTSIYENKLTNNLISFLSFCVSTYVLTIQQQAKIHSDTEARMWFSKNFLLQFQFNKKSLKSHSRVVVA